MSSTQCSTLSGNTAALGARAEAAAALEAAQQEDQEWRALARAGFEDFGSEGFRPPPGEPSSLSSMLRALQLEAGLAAVAAQAEAEAAMAEGGGAGAGAGA